MKKISVLFLALFVSVFSYSQGCSDAGVCSIGGMKDHQNAEEKFTLALNTQYGLGEQKVSILIPQLEFAAKLGDKSFLQIKLPYFFTSGNLGKYNGLGDITATFSQTVFKNEDWKLGLNGGLKIGVNDANQKGQASNSLTNTSNFLALPMPYQSSLGTHDLLLGFDAKLKNRWLFALGFQMPVIQFNNSNFDTSKAFPGETEKKKYFSSNQLFRRPDLVLRIDRQFKASEKLYINGGLLPIYHLGHDRYKDSTGASQTISGSKGLTLNINFGISYQLADNFTMTARYASPLIVRKVRPDGLTREFVSGLELKLAF